MATNDIKTAIAKYNEKMHKTYAWFFENALDAENIAVNFACHINEDSNFGVTQISNLCQSMPAAIKREVIKACLAILQNHFTSGQANRSYHFDLTLVIQYCNEK